MADETEPIEQGWDFPHEIAGQLTRRLAAERDYVDGKVAVLEQRLAGMDEATRVLSKQVNDFPTDVDVAVDHLKELTQEKFDGVGLVLDEQRRAIKVAEEEREKAASALRIELSRAIEEGDRNLRDHITAQIAQINAALVSAGELEQDRIARVGGQIVAERRITELTRELSDLAISKAEVAAEKQFESLRAQLSAMSTSLDSMSKKLA